MIVKINLGLRSCTDFRNPDEEALSPLCIDNVEFLKMEPPCPFCGQSLMNAQCKCSDFKTAFKKLQKEYDQDDLQAKITECFVNAVAIVEPKNIEMIKINHADVPFSIFDYGTISSVSALGRKAGDWLLSRGVYDEEKSQLSFYVRKKGHEQVYLCKIKEIDCSFGGKNEVVLYHNYDKMVPYSYSGPKIIGAYRIEVKKHIFASLIYDEYVQKLKTLFSSAIES